MVAAASQRRIFENWVWCFPAAFLIHANEEYWCGEGFYRWVARIIGKGMMPRQFIILNGFAWLLMAGSVLVFRKTPSVKWLTLCLATTLFINGWLHLFGTLWANVYSPGVISGVGLFIPLGAVTYYRAWRRISTRSFVGGVLGGVTIHSLLFLVLLYL
jgi:hypothetical protein